MALETGTRLGPYEIVGLLGAGGMGEVYRARDPRIGRDVAVKVLPSTVVSDPERRTRFEAEARAAGALNHPNIITLHDVGVAGEIPYLVTEVLEGETLAGRLAAGPLNPRVAARIVAQVARGLSAAHAKGIAHRDLKPANLFLLPDDRVKILDFGIAKLFRTEPDGTAETTPVFASLTAAGTVVGTVSYMAPEQLRDRAVDHRADLFAIGAILYEMVSGRHAFQGDTAADRVSAILSAEPEPLAAEIEAELPGLSGLLRRCLEKRPETRFESASDLAYALEILVEAAGARGASAGDSGAPPGIPRLTIRTLTFREGAILSARFAPDGTTVVYHAAWEGGGGDLYLTRTDNPDYRPLHLAGARLLSVSSGAELAIGLDPRDMGGFITLHTLARVSMMGGIPRELARDVFAADWGPDGRSIAAIRQVGGRHRLEYPLGRVVHEATGWLSAIRVSPDGKQLAFFDHPIGGDNAGHLTLLEPGRPARRLVPGLDSAASIAWHPTGKEIWFSAADQGGLGAVWAARLDGDVRRIHQTLGWPALDDISGRGEALITQLKPRLRMQTGTRAGRDALELSWLDWSLCRDISKDGSLVLFDETGPGTAHSGIVFIRSMDGSPAVRLADGVAMAFMPDGGHVLTLNRHKDPPEFVIHPLGAGEPRPFPAGDLQVHFARPFPDGASLCVVANRSGETPALFRLDLATGVGVPMTKEPISIGYPMPSPDGRSILARRPDGRFAVYPADGSPVIEVPDVQPHERPCGWTPDGRAVYAYARGVIPAVVERVDLESGRREPWLTVEPITRSGVGTFGSLFLTLDGHRYAGSFNQSVGDLFLVGGLG